MRGGENRKTEIQNEGVGGGGFLFMYLSTIICNGGQRGWGSWGALCPCHAALAHCPKVTVTCTPCPYGAHQ